MNPFSKNNHESLLDIKKREVVDKYKLTKVELDALSGVNTEDELESFVKELIEYRDDKNRVDNLLKGVNVFDNAKDPLEIRPDELDKIMSYKTNSEQQAEVGVAVGSARKIMISEEMKIYIKNRNRRNSDGSLDDFVSSDELREIEREAEKKLTQKQREAGVRDADKLSDVLNTLNDMSVESRYRYEGYKEGVCNDFGITPESFDAWYAAVLEDNTERLTTEGINNRTELYKIADLQKKHKGLLKKVEGWKPGDVVYKSEFNARIAEIDAEELRKAEKTATPEGKKLYKEMVADTFHSPDNPVKLKTEVSKDDAKYFFRNRSKRKSVEVEPVVEKEVVSVEEPKVKLDDLLAQTTETPRVVAHMEYPETVDKEKFLKEWDEKQKADLELAEKLEAEKEVKQDLTPDVKKYVDMGLSIEQAELLVKADQKQSETSPEPVKQEVIEEVVEEPAKVKEPRIKPNRGVIDDYSKYEETEADPSILRTGSNRLDALRRYKESAKKGRKLFLPNSNYEVYVKKIKSTESIGYMTTLLNNMKDMNLVEAYVKSEVLRICYENIEFDFPEEVTYDDFVRCLHESDMTILMMMLALVNIPEDSDGKIPLEIKSVMCTNPECGAIGNFKEALKLDLKEEFVNIYPVEIFATEYARYKNANYETIYHAYRAGEVGKMTRHTVSDDMFRYEFIVSAPTVFKTQAIKSARDEVSYKRVLDRLTNRIELFKASNDNYVEVKDYMDTHTYQEYAKEIAQVSMGVIENAPDERRLVLTMISDEMDDIRKNDLPWYLIMDAIDQITVTTSEGEEVVSRLDQKDVYTMIGILEQCPKSMLDVIIGCKNDTIDKAYPVDIEFSAEDVAGKFDFDGYYGTDEEMIEEIKRRNEGSMLSEEDLNKLIEAQQGIRNGVKPDYNEKGICFCKNDKWKLNYTAILFFWTSNQSQIAVK